MFPIGARIEYTSSTRLVHPGVVQKHWIGDPYPTENQGFYSLGHDDGMELKHGADPKQVHPRGTYIFPHKDIVYMYLPWCSTGTRRKLEVVIQMIDWLAKTDLGFDNAFARIAGPYVRNKGCDQSAENQISEVFMAALQSVRAPHLPDCNAIICIPLFA